MNDYLLETHNLSKTFISGDLQVQAVREVQFVVNTGEFVSIIGNSGSGKSTLLHLIAGLVPPTKGDVLFHGKSLQHQSEKEIACFRRRNIGFVYQFHNLIESMTALENIIIPALLLGKEYKEVTDKALQMMKRFGIQGSANKMVWTLSGGEKQRVGISRALINDPPLLLADEPTGSLDAKAGEETVQLFAELQKMGQTILMVTHDLILASRAHRVLFLQDGKLTSDTSTQVRRDPQQLLTRIVQAGVGAKGLV